MVYSVSFKKLCGIMAHTRKYHHCSTNYDYKSVQVAMLLSRCLHTLGTNVAKITPAFGVRKTLEEASHIHPLFNVSSRIMQLSESNLLHIANHPLAIIKERIKESLGSQFTCFDTLSPIVTIENNFDVLNIPPEHPSRSPTDTYYIDDTRVLRTHTSAHQKELMSQGLHNFAVFGDVYRRDEIDRYHYPVFHQMEAVRILGHRDACSVADAVENLKGTIEIIVKNLFGPCEKRWTETYFPFTEPSFELEIFFDGKWVEMLGCGIIHDRVLARSGRQDERGWAAGLGLERFAMKLFKIPDVRLFWSTDSRFLSQFHTGVISEFKDFSKYPSCYKDISMWITPHYNPNDLFGIIREIGGDLIEAVEELSTYTDTKSGRTSKAYRILFRSLERTLGNEEVIKYQFMIRDEIGRKLPTVTLR